MFRQAYVIDYVRTIILIVIENIYEKNILIVILRRCSLFIAGSAQSDSIYYRRKDRPAHVAIR